MRLFKVLNMDTPHFGGCGWWYLPLNGKPGKWMPPVTGELVPCVNGYHLLREQDLIYWFGPDLYEAEYRGEIVEDKNKVVVREARLLRRVDTYNSQTLRLFAADCIEHVLPFFYDLHPTCSRFLYDAVEVGREFARGRVTDIEADRTGAAVWSVTKARDRVAECVLSATAELLTSASRPYVVAHCASSYALLAVSAATGRREAEEEESRWQTQRLLEYLYP